MRVKRVCVASASQFGNRRNVRSADGVATLTPNAPLAPTAVGMTCQVKVNPGIKWWLHALPSQVDLDQAVKVLDDSVSAKAYNQARCRLPTMVNVPILRRQ